MDMTKAQQKALANSGHMMNRSGFTYQPVSIQSPSEILRQLPKMNTTSRELAEKRAERMDNRRSL
jgi:hypothetical protein